MGDKVWQCYEHFPDLSRANIIAFDVETNDPNLLEKGPGTIRRDGYVIGFSLATDDGFKGYYPIRHQGGGNLPNIPKAIKWLRDTLENDVPKVGANILYDSEWAKCDLNIDIKGKKYDVQVAAPLLDENFSTYKLDALAERILNRHKDEDELYKAAINILGITSNAKTEKEKYDKIMLKAKGEMWKLHAKYVGLYGEADATLPIEIFKIQEKQLKDQKLWDLFLMECEVLDLLLEMRFKGVPVDIPNAEKVRDELSLLYDEEVRKIKRRAGFQPNVWSADDLAKVCERLGLKYGRTKPSGRFPNGNPSFDAEWLGSQEHPIFQMILSARQYDRSGGVFIQSKILDMEVRGRIYPSFWQVKTERGGTVSGRFASSNPNAQQFPARNKILAKKVRSLLIAEPGCQWGVFDYSQQEPRCTVHYASLLGLPGAEEAKQKYINNPNTDYHRMVSELTQIERKTAKNINLGLAYGMGPKKFSEKYGKTYDEAKKLYAIYHKRLPFIKALSDRCERMAKQRGYIKTLLGRHCHFNLFGPPRWSPGIIPKRKDEAIKEFGLPVQQYFTYRAMNRLIQGSSADMIKKAMVDCYKAGYIPNLTVHDELDFADIENEKQIKEISEIMINAVKLEVPIKLDVELGPNWGECK